MRLHFTTAALSLSLLPLSLLSLPTYAQDQLRVTVSHQLADARPSETITIPWSQINQYLPNALIQRIVVKDKDGKILPHQVTNVAPQAKDPQGVGIA